MAAPAPSLVQLCRVAELLVGKLKITLLAWPCPLPELPWGSCLCHWESAPHTQCCCLMGQSYLPVFLQLASRWQALPKNVGKVPRVPGLDPLRTTVDPLVRGQESEPVSTRYSGHHFTSPHSSFSSGQVLSLPSTLESPKVLKIS